ncbi:MAG: hypothetical protein GC191_05355 [Azospirillum sp.]|nr:hypothetical protein [Azospirillum sp.]
MFCRPIKSPASSSVLVRHIRDGAAAHRPLRTAIGVILVFFIMCSSTQALNTPDQEKFRVVDVGIYISNLFDFNYIAGSYKVSFWLWFKSDDENYEPEKAIEIIGGRDIKIDSLSTERLSDGKFYRSMKYTATISQVWDVRWFPFDTQKLKIVIEGAADDASKHRFVVNSDNAQFDNSIILPGWSFRAIDVQSGYAVYQTDFGTGNQEASTYSRVTTTITLDHAGARVFSTAFLGFFVADMLTGVTLLVESFEATRLAVPLIARLNMVVGALFGAVGNKYIIDSSLPPMPTFSLSDLVQVSTFSAIAVAIFTVIGAETMVVSGYSPAAVSAVARSSIGLYIASQLALAAYIFKDVEH